MSAHKAVLWTRYGSPDVLKMGELPTPEPRDNEVLVKVEAATVTAGDCELRRFDLAGWIWLPVRLFMGVFKPRIKVLGQEFSGRIEKVGNKVKAYQTGDEIFTSGGMKMGGYAEYVILPETHIMSLKPETIDYAEVATIPTGGINGIHFLKIGEVKKGDKVLINGAGGSIGTYATQIAKLWGAHVTCVDHGNKLAMLKDIGADKVIDYQEEEFTQLGEKYDVIIDIAGKISYFKSLKLLNPNGRFVLGNPRHLWMMIWAKWVSVTTDKKVAYALAKENIEDYDYIKKLLAEKSIKVIIDRTYPLEEVPEAHIYVETGRKSGNVIINV